MTRPQSASQRSRTISLLVAISVVTACSSDGPTPPGAVAGAGGGATSAGASAGGGAGEGGSVAGMSGSGGGGMGGAGGSGGGAGAPAGGAGGSAGGASAACHSPGPSGMLTTRLPCLLSETGLYGADMTTLAEGVHPYSPSFELWTDGAEKKRWIQLPPGTKIDTTDMDYWSFPPGTKLWKEFTRDSVRVETRLLQKQASGAWYAVAYHWRADQKEADAVPNGLKDASGTPHDVPNGDDCLTCHSQMPDKVLGFSAIQLSHAASALEWSLETLVKDGLLTNPPAQSFSVPGSALDRSFFGYLHSNCGHCHNPRGSANMQTGLDLWLKVTDLSGPVTGFSVYQGIFDTDIVWLDAEHPDAPKRIAPGSLANSAMYQRFVEKGHTWSMPPLGTEVVDPTAKKLFEDWITAPR